MSALLMLTREAPAIILLFVLPLAAVLMTYLICSVNSIRPDDWVRIGDCDDAGFAFEMERRKREDGNPWLAVQAAAVVKGLTTCCLRDYGKEGHGPKCPFKNQYIVYAAVPPEERNA